MGPREGESSAGRAGRFPLVGGDEPSGELARPRSNHAPVVAATEARRRSQGRTRPPVQLSSAQSAGPGAGESEGPVARGSRLSETRPEDLLAQARPPGAQRGFRRDPNARGHSEPACLPMRGGIRHAPGICRLLAEIHPEAWSVDQVEREFRRGDSRVWLVIGGDFVAGLLLARRVVDELHILEVGVAAPFRRQGIARMLIAAAADEARETTLLLEVRASNQPARNLYACCGFVVEGRRPRYYPGGEDALLMTL